MGSLGVWGTLVRSLDTPFSRGDLSQITHTNLGKPSDQYDTYFGCRNDETCCVYVCWHQIWLNAQDSGIEACDGHVHG
jgi:hypothetical protein